MVRIKVEPFWELGVCAGPPGQLSRWTCFSKITNKKVPKIKQKKQKKKTQQNTTKKNKSLVVIYLVFLSQPAKVGRQEEGI